MKGCSWGQPFVHREESNTLREKTIAAIATPWGEGGIGIIRISGAEAISIADRVVRLANRRHLAECAERTVYYGRATADGIDIDEILVFFFRAPKSYTREDLVEIQAHGGTVVLNRLLQAVLTAGAVLADPGEFTARAVWHGRLTVIQAEAVLDLVRAKTDAAAAAALRRLSGDSGRELLAVEKEVLAALAEIEAWLDFPDDVPEPARAVLAGRAAKALGGLDSLLAGAERGRLLAEGAAVVIVGRPNVGKSSLLNALLGEDRAIVADRPGTTRDAVAEEISLRGIPVRLIDTAGIGRTGDEIETLGMDRSRRELARADLALVVLDVSENVHEQDTVVAEAAAACGRGLVVMNKTDLPEILDPSELPRAIAAWPVVRVSALTGRGLNELIDAMLETLGGRQGEGTPILGHLRQIEAARAARAALADFEAGLAQDLPADLLAEDLRGGLAALGKLTGRTVGPEVIKEIFSRFCVGK